MTTTNETRTAPSIEHALKVYSGREGCMCGCKGRYAYSKTAEAQAKTDLCTVNETQVKKVLGLLAADSRTTRSAGLGDEQVLYLEIPNADESRPSKVLAAYFGPGADLSAFPAEVCS